MPPALLSDETSSNEDDNFPTVQLAVLAICRLAEPVAFTSIIAYNYVFVQDLRPGDENPAFYAGLLISAFALAEAAAAMPWGTVSDWYGRKPVVLFGLAGVALSNLIFGFATNYWVAFGARVIGGALNGNVAVMQTMVAEMCKKPEHEPRAYTMIPFMWSAGSIFGAAMGGYLARPADTWPRLFPKASIFTRFPYLLPNVVAATFIVFAILLGMAFLKETNVHARSPLFARLNLPDERTRLMNPGPEASNVNAADQSKPREHRTSFASMPPLTLGTTIDIRRLSASTAAESIKPNVVEGDNETAIEDDGDGSEHPLEHRYSRAMILLITQLFLMSYHQMGFSALTPIFLLDGPSSEDKKAEHKLDLQGGLAYTIRDVGMFMAVNGFVALVIQLAIVPPFIAKVGVWKSFVWLTVLCPIVYVFIPFLTALPRPQLPIGIYATLILQAFTLLIIYPCLLIALKNATPSMSMLGQVNGLAMAGCSGARTISPPAAGAFYSKAGSAAGWWSVGVVAVMAAVLLLFMEPPTKGEVDEAT